MDSRAARPADPDAPPRPQGQRLTPFSGPYTPGDTEPCGEWPGPACASESWGSRKHEWGSSSGGFVSAPGQLLRESPSGPGGQVGTQDTTASNASEGPWSTPFTEEETRPSLQAGSHAAHGGWRCARLALTGQPPQLREVVRPGTWSGAGVRQEARPGMARAGWAWEAARAPQGPRGTSLPRKLTPSNPLWVGPGSWRIPSWPISEICSLPGLLLPSPSVSTIKSGFSAAPPSAHTSVPPVCLPSHRPVWCGRRCRAGEGM